MFLVLMVVGLAGLAVMALPALGGRHAGGGHGLLRAGHVGRLAPGHVARIAGGGAGKLAAGHAAAGKALVPQHATGVTRFLPSPRLVLSLLALYGAFGNVLVALGLAPWAAALAAIAPAALVERFAVTPVWRLLFRFQGEPSGPLEELVMSDATAVTEFRKGRGIVSLVRDGRRVQFSARLVERDANLPVWVGDRLRVEDVDAARERLTVSVPRE